MCSDVALRVRTLTTVAHMGPEADGLVPHVIAQLHTAELVHAAATTLAAVGPAAVPELIRALTQPEPAFRLEVVKVLGVIQAPRTDVVHALDRALADADRSIRMQAAVLLCQFGHPSAEALGELREALNQPDLRARAIAFLGDVGPQASEAVPALAALLEDPRVSVRDDIWIPAVGKMGPGAHRVVPLLVDKLREADHPLYPVHAAAVKALGQIGPRAVPALIAALERRHPHVRAGAAEALGQIGPEARRAIPALVDRLADAEAEVRQCAVAALGSIGPVVALKELQAALRDPEPSVRRAAVVALARMHQVPLRDLLEMVADGDASVSESAVEALDQYRGPQRWWWYQQSFALSRRGRVRAEALHRWARVQMEEGAVHGLESALLDALKDRDYRVRQAAAAHRDQQSEAVRKAIPRDSRSPIEVEEQEYDKE
jgi:HEAT repeat protein